MAVTFAVIAVITASLWRSRAAIRQIEDWKATTNPTLDATVAAWKAATSLTFRQYQRNVVRVGAFAIETRA